MIEALRVLIIIFCSSVFLFAIVLMVYDVITGIRGH